MEEMKAMKHETTSTYNTEGRTFIINAYDPMTGNYLLMQLLTMVLPMGIDSMLSGAVGTEVSNKKIGTPKMMSKDEFIQLQTDILSTVYELYESGQKSPVVRPNHTYGVTNVSMMLLLKLIVASLAFNFKDFFDALPSPKETGQDPDSKSAATLTSMLGSIFQ